jgi:hypothetical protein
MIIKLRHSKSLCVDYKTFTDGGGQYFEWISIKKKPAPGKYFAHKKRATERQAKEGERSRARAELSCVANRYKGLTD